MATNSVSRSRATNLTGLIDIDALVEANTLRQKQKINTATQKLKVEQYKQEQYRTIQKKAKTFYNKYLDVLSGNSLMNSNTYNTMKATSSNSDNVTAKASSSAKSGNYQVTVSKPAKARTAEISAENLESLDKITINNVEFELSGADAKEKAENLNKKLKEKGLNVTAAYTDLYSDGKNYGGMILKSTVTGSNEDLLTVTGANSIHSVEVVTDASKSSYKSFSIPSTNLKNSDVLKLNDEISVTIKDPDDLDALATELNTAISSNSKYKNLMKAEVKEDESGKKSLVISRTSYDTSENTVDFNPKVNDAEILGITSTPQNILTHSVKLDLNKLNSDNNVLVVGGKSIKFAIDSSDDSKTIDNLNAALKTAGINVEAKKNSSGDFILESKKEGETGKFEAVYRENNNSATGVTIKEGSDSKITIKDLATGQERIYEDGASEIEVDGITFKIDENAEADSTTKVTVGSDVSDLKKKIVDFVNDYNELMGTINEKLYETRDKSYMPLTDEDKEGLSDSEIEKLEKKAQEGLLKNDSYLRNFADDMKLTMTTMLGDSGLSLEKIGIKPVSDYTTQNGLFTIDEEALKSALEENNEGIQKLFTGDNGIISKLKDNLYDHATGSFSKLANRAGVASSVTANTNEMTKDIEQRKKLITQMQTALKEKEDALYTRYATLESNLSSLQAQQSSLSSYFS